jgi:hypothetical protein
MDFAPPYERINHQIGNWRGGPDSGSELLGAAWLEAAFLQLEAPIS